MKKYLFMFAMVFIGYTATAQFTIGPRVALTNSTLSLKDAQAALAEGDAEVGYQFGLFARFKMPIIGLYIQPEILLTNSDQTLSINNTEVDLSFNRIDMPIMIGQKFGPFRVNAGPALRFLTSADSDILGDIQDNYESVTMGWQAGVGLDLLKFVIDIKYEGSLSAFGNEIPVNGLPVSADQRISQFVFAVGFKLVK